MAGGRREHNRIKENRVRELYSRLKGGPCQTFSNDQRVVVESIGFYAYLDVLMVCASPTYDPADRDTFTNPTDIIEIISPSTEHYDRGAQFRAYQQIPSLIEFILVAEDEAVCERFLRQFDGSWALVSFVGFDADLAFMSISARIPLADIYSGVKIVEGDGR